MDHIKRANPEHEETVENPKILVLQGDVFSNTVVTEKAGIIFSWPKTVTDEPESLTFVEKKFIGKNIKMQLVCYEKLCNYMLEVTKYVKVSLYFILPKGLCSFSTAGLWVLDTWWQFLYPFHLSVTKNTIYFF